MTGLDEVRSAVVSTLTLGGVKALAAWPGAEYSGLDQAVVAVSVRSATDSPGGFFHYLGERYDPVRDVWQERYGKRIQVEFGLDVYAPPIGGAQACQDVFAKVVEALYELAPSGLKVEEIGRDEVAYDKTLRVMHCPVQVKCQAFLYASLEEGEILTDFEVKGEQM